MFPAILTAVCFAISAILGHRATKLAGALEANLWRVIIATVLLSAWAFTFGGGLGGGVLVLFALSGAVGVGLGDMAFYHALPRLGTRIATLVSQCLMAPLGALIEWLWLGTQPTLHQALFSIVAISGVVIAVRPASGGNKSHITPGGIFLAVLGAAGTAAGAVISRKAYDVLQAGGVSLDSGTAGFQRMTGGIVVSALFYTVLRLRFAASNTRPIQTHTPRQIWPWILGNALAGQTLGVTCMQWALSEMPARHVLLIVSTTPVVVIPLARFFERERITPRAILGALIAVGGVMGLILHK
jgi:drug/metabolite transporter (DMT)-like permease